MKRTGYASLPLHGGQAPVWLFSRMVPLLREILRHIVEEYGTREVLRRLSDVLRRAVDRRSIGADSRAQTARGVRDLGQLRTSWIESRYVRCSDRLSRSGADR